MSENTGKKVSTKKRWLVEFVLFKKMIAPTLIQVFFWIGIVVCIIAGMIMITNSADMYSVDETQRNKGIFLILAGPILLRVFSELMILLFSIHSTLRDIKNNLER